MALPGDPGAWRVGIVTAIARAPGRWPGHSGHSTDDRSHDEGALLGRHEREVQKAGAQAAREARTRRPLPVEADLRVRPSGETSNGHFFCCERKARGQA